MSDTPDDPRRTGAVFGLGSLMMRERNMDAIGAIFGLCSMVHGRPFWLPDAPGEEPPGAGGVMYEAYMADVGKAVHAYTYAAGLDDHETDRWTSEYGSEGHDEVQKEIPHLYQELGPLDCRFAARWWDQACPVVIMPETFIAGLMATVAPDALVSDMVPPWRAFSIRVPRGVLLHDDKEGGEVAGVSRINVLYEELPAYGGVWTVIAQTDLRGLFVHRVRAHEFRDLAGLPNASRIPELAHSPEDERTMQLVMRVVAGVCLAMVGQDDKRTVRPRKGGARGAQRGAKGPQTTLVRLGEPLEIDLREEVRAVALGKQRTGKSPTVQTCVRWHWKRQHHGPRNTLVKWIRVAPYFRGPVDAPVLVRPAKVVA